jgi:hypothetical protein
MSLKLNSSGGGSVTLQEPVTASDLTVNLPTTSGTMVLDGGSPTFGTVTSTALTVNGNNISAVNSMGFRNRIINGDMRIDQRNAGAAVTLTNSAFTYTVDRWASATPLASSSTVTAQRVSSGLSSFPNALRILRGSGTYNSNVTLIQEIETLNCQDLAGQTVTVSYWLRKGSAFSASGVYLQGISGSGTDQGILSANNGTWTNQASPVLISTTSSNISTSFTQFVVTWSIPAGTNELAFYFVINGFSGTGSANDFLDITGVQLEAGTVATPFERRDYGRELIMCQRYYEKSYPIGTVPGASSITSGMSWLVNGYSSNIYVLCTTTFKATKRTSATIAYWDAAGNSLRTTSLTGGGLSQVDNNNNIYATISSESGFFIYILAAPPLNYGVQWTASAEL